jgi:hypothetical protein
MKRLLREPLLHFVLLGAALFAALSLGPDRGRPRETEIVVSAGKIEHLAALFARTWQRPATPEELQGLITDFVREEAAYREGMAAGLDLDDTIIRRRIRQKLEFVAEDLASQAEPTDRELAAYLAAHPEDFRVDPRVSFRHVYFNPEERGDGLDSEVRDVLSLLDGDPLIDAGRLGDRILLEHSYADIPALDVANLFGAEFAAAIVEIDPGEWHGPVRSGYGMHLVFVDQRSEGRLPELDEVRDQVRREWANVRRLDAIDKFYRSLLDRYDIVIEWPKLDTQDQGL